MSLRIQTLLFYHKPKNFVYILGLQNTILVLKNKIFSSKHSRRSSKAKIVAGFQCVISEFSILSYKKECKINFAELLYKSRLDTKRGCFIEIISEKIRLIGYIDYFYVRI